MPEQIEKAGQLGNIFKCLAEAFLSGNGTSAACYLVPPEISDALVIVAQFIAEAVKGWA